jgi:two-component system sensor histidine kinase RegB
MLSRMPMGQPDSGDARSHVSLRWLILVRWGAAAGQLATLLIADWALGLALPLAPLFAIVSVAAATNLAAARMLDSVGSADRTVSSGLLAGSLLAIDTILLTISLALTGGPQNPFSVFYLVYITLAAVVLGARWTWFLTVLAACSYGSLFLYLMTRPPEVPGDHSTHIAVGLSHLQGMWWAFLLAASLTAYFVVKLSSAIERRDRELALMREQALRNERLASLTTLAAGAAHELSTPLATIAVVTGEIERALEQARTASLANAANAPTIANAAHASRAASVDVNAVSLPSAQPSASSASASNAPPSSVPLRDGLLTDALLTDARLIRAELQRCRAILDRMAAQAGETVGEMPAPVSVSALVADALRALPPDEAARVRVDAPEMVATLTVPGHGVVTALVSLLRNAMDASEQSKAVTLAAAADNGIVRLTVRDWGSGMAPDVLARAGEPFFSTKPAGAGMGLGLFLTRALAERLGGALRLESAPGSGTAATLELPASHRP